MWEGSGRTLYAPSRFAHSAGDEGEDLLGKRDNNAARDGEHAVGALGGVVALEGQAQLEDAERVAQRMLDEHIDEMKFAAH